MRNMLLATALLAAIGASPAHAVLVTVDDLGVISNESVALPAQATPGSGQSFTYFFEFTLPQTESVTVSVSDSATGSQRVINGVLSLNDWTSSALTSPFQPMGSLIESANLVNVLGGQEATVIPDSLVRGAYFVELAGLSGGAPIRIVIDGTLTATAAVPEPSTWALMAVGLAFMGFANHRRRRNRLVAFT
jgi:hypothetical protein